MTQYYLKLSENLKYDGNTYHEGLNLHYPCLSKIEEIRIDGIREKLAYVHFPYGVQKNPHGIYVCVIIIDRIIDITEHPEYSEICRRSVSDRGYNLQFIPAEWQTENICRIAIQQNVYAIGYVVNQTKELCEMAVRRDGDVLMCIDNRLKTKELCRLAIQSDRTSGAALKYVPKEFITAELCMMAVRRTGWALNYVPVEFKTYELCVAAIARHDIAYMFFPK